MSAKPNRNAAVMAIYNDKLIHNYEILKAKAAGQPQHTDKIDLESISRIYREAVIENEKLREQNEKLERQLQQERVSRERLQVENGRLLQMLQHLRDDKERLKAANQSVLNANLALHNSSLCLSTQLSAMQSKVDGDLEKQHPGYIEISPTSQISTPLLPARTPPVHYSPAIMNQPRCPISMLDNPLIEELS